MTQVFLKKPYFFRNWMNPKFFLNFSGIGCVRAKPPDKIPEVGVVGFFSRKI